MDRGEIERIKKISNEELLRETERTGSKGVIASEEILLRISQGKITEERKYLEAILENVRVSGSPDVQRRAEKVINKTAELIKERGYLNERNLSNILKKAGNSIKEKIGRKWLNKEKVSNHSLREIIFCIPSLKEEAEERLLKQDPDKDDLYCIVMEGKGKFQLEAFEIYRKKGIPIDDACDFIQLKDDFAIPTWEMLKEEGRIKAITIEDLVQNFNFTSFFEIKQETVEKLWFRRRDKLGEEELKLVMDNAEMIRSGDPQKIRNEIGKMLYEKMLSLEKILHIKEKVVSPELKLRFAKRALSLVNEKIGKIEEKAEWEINDYDKRRLIELKVIKEKLKKRNQRTPKKTC